MRGLSDEVQGSGFVGTGGAKQQYFDVREGGGMAARLRMPLCRSCIQPRASAQPRRAWLCYSRECLPQRKRDAASRASARPVPRPSHPGDTFMNVSAATVAEMRGHRMPERSCARCHPQSPILSRADAGACTSSSVAADAQSCSQYKRWRMLSPAAAPQTRQATMPWC